MVSSTEVVVTVVSSTSGVASLAGRCANLSKACLHNLHYRPPTLRRPHYISRSHGSSNSGSASTPRSCTAANASTAAHPIITLVPVLCTEVGDLNQTLAGVPPLLPLHHHPWTAAPPQKLSGWKYACGGTATASPCLHASCNLEGRGMICC